MEIIPEEILSEKTRKKFTDAVDRQNDIAHTAIQSLDCLNDQIIQYIFTPDNNEIDLDKDLSDKEQETLKSSMVLIRRLLLDAQAKFRKMVEDNKQLAARIDGSISAANLEVNALRVELADTNKRLTEISTGNGKKDSCTQADTEYTCRHKVDEENELIQLREENSRLECQVRSLSREVEELRLRKAFNSDHPNYGEVKLDLYQSKQELNRAKDALQGLKGDRKRLKAEKLDLLNQLKQLYGALEDKEAELRDFIRNYEQRMRESDECIKQLAAEKEESEREKWEIIKQARDAAERAVILRSQLDTKDQQLKKLETEVSELKEQISGQTSKMSSSSFADTPDSPDSPESFNTPGTTSDELPPYETPPPSANYSSKDEQFQVPTSTPKEPRERSDSLTPLIQLFDPNASHRSLNESPPEPKKKKRISLGSISKVFTRGRTRRSIAISAGVELDDPALNSRITLLSPDNYQEKLQLVEQSKGSHMTTWKANQVLAWLEIVLSMPMYGKMCAENVKSGKVLLGLSDSELGSALGMTNPMHRRKLRLAIDEQRNPSEIAHPRFSTLDHTWVAHRWVSDLGLPQYMSVFESNLVDGRLLNTLFKKDLEKHFGIHRKFHQASIFHGVELLRRLSFDKELLTDRRTKSESSDTDPQVWTNERVIKWIQSIDLEEYAEALRESGVHGALMVLEPSFNADTLATALGIPPSKSYIRRHLATELDALIKPARASLNMCNGNSNSPAGKLSLNRSYRSSSMIDSGSKTRLSFRGSLGRAFGRKIRDDLKIPFDLETPKRKISAPIPIQHNFTLPISDLETIQQNTTV